MNLNLDIEPDDDDDSGFFFPSLRAWVSYGYPLSARGLSVVTNVSVFVLNVRYAKVISVLIIIATQKHKMTGTNKFQTCWL